MFLGIDMGHLIDVGSVLDKSEWLNGNRVPVDKNWIVETNTGMSCVVPAWKVWELLHVEELVNIRKEVLNKLEEGKQSSPVSFDVSEPEHSFTQKDFVDALEKASRKAKASKGEEA